MPIEVTCTNTKCGETFPVSEEMLGETVLCPRCARPILVEGQQEPLEGFSAGQQEEGRAGEEPALEEQDVEPSEVYHPARQVCPACGAVLGVRVTYCPKCGADIRTGAVAEGERTAPSAISTVLLVGSLVVGLAVLSVLGFAAFRMVQRRRAETRPAEAALPAEEEPAEAPPPEPEPAPEPLKHYELPAELAGQVEQQLERTKRSVQEFYDELTETLQLAAEADPDQAAGHWAELFSWCRKRGLAGEADLCWFQAVRLAPTDPAVNRALGRSQTVEGAAVTPEQAEFLRVLRPRVRVANLSPALDEHAVGIGDGPVRPLPRGGVLDLEPQRRVERLKLYRVGQLETPLQALPLEVAPGLIQRVELHGTYAAPGLPLAQAEKLYLAVGTGQSSGVRIQRDSAGGVLRARTGPLRAEGTSEEPFQMWYSPASQQVGFIGRIRMGDSWSAAGEHLLEGTSQRPGSLLVDRQAGRLQLVAGSYARLRTRLSDRLWVLLGSVQGDLASEWARLRLARRLGRLQEEMVELQARGDLEVPWQSLPRLYEGLKEKHLQAREDRRLQDRAATRPAGLDRVRTLGAKDRSERLFLNWPRFRHALARSLKGTGPHILARIGVIGSADAGAAGDALGPRPHERQRYEPPQLALDDSQRACVQISALSLLPDSFVVARLERDWAQMGLRDRAASLDVLRHVGTPAAVEFLGRVSERAETLKTIERAMLALGSVGGRQALRYLDRPAVDSRIRMAARAGKAIAGDPAVIQEVGSFLGAASAARRGDFCRFISQGDTPGTLLAMSAAIDTRLSAGDRKQLARGLLRIGGRTATYELGRLMEASGSVWPELLDRVEPEHAAPLVPSLGPHLYRTGGPPSVAALLAEIGTEPALDYLRATVEDTGSEDALRALVLNGSPACLRTAATVAPSVRMALLQEARRRWYAAGEGPGEWAWNPGVDAAAARHLLEAVATNGADATARVAAAAMLQGTGGSVNVDALAELVRRGQRQGAPDESGPAPPGFEPPEARPLVPDVLRMDGRPALYALGLLQERGDQAALEALRSLSAELEDGSLKAAAAVALARAGGAAELEALRRVAAEARQTYDSVAEWTAGLEDRLAALAALGAAGDMEFLPALPELLAEQAPEPAAGASEEPQDRARGPWWRMQLYRAACECLVGICRSRTTGGMALDRAVADTLYARLRELVEDPVGGPADLAAERRRMRTAALRAVGCIARPDDPAHLEFVGRVARQVGERQDALGASAVAAVAHLAARSDAPESLLDVLDRLLEGGRQDAAWEEAVRGMAAAPRPGLWRVLSSHVGLLEEEPLADVLLEARQAAGGREYARCLALAMQRITPPRPAAPKAAKAPRAKPQKAAKARAEAPARGRAQGRPKLPEGLDLDNPNIPPDVRRQLAEKYGVALEEKPPKPAPAAESTSSEEHANEGPPPWRFLAWSYSLDGLAAEVAELQEDRPWVEELMGNDTADVLAAMRETGWLTDGPFGPPVAARLAERDPAVLAEAAEQVGGMLLAGLSMTSRGGGLTDAARRGAVVALRRMGGQDAARALYLGLVGPPLGDAALRRAGSQSLSASPVAHCIGRALGTMGEVRLLTDALNAATHEFMLANSTRTQAAALEGIAYLPAERDPVRLLQGFLQSGTSGQFQNAVGAALGRAVRRMGTDQDTGADQ